MGKKVRLDRLLVDRELMPSSARAQARIISGDVYVAGEKVTKAGTQVSPNIELEVRGDKRRFASRGGLKLDQALTHFGVDVAGAIAMDIGASTGGFTDCLLQRDAAKVYAVDVGYGQLAWKLRTDERVVNIERTNIRALDRTLVPDAVDLVVADCSFIALHKVMAPARRHLAPSGQGVVLVKPQFEVARGQLGKGGVVRDADARAAAIEETRDALVGLGYEVVDGVDCATHGPKGNVEHLLWLKWSEPFVVEPTE